MKLLEHSLLSTLQNEEKMEQYLEQFGDKPSSIDPMIWQVHLSAPVRKRMKVLNTYFDQLLKKYKILYSFLPEPMVFAKIFKLLNVPYTVSSSKTSSVDYISRKKLPKSPRIDRYLKIYNTVHKKKKHNELGIYEFNEKRPGPFVPYTDFRKECKNKKSEKLTAENVLNQLIQARNSKSINMRAPEKTGLFSEDSYRPSSSTKTIISRCRFSSNKSIDSGFEKKSYRIFKEKNRVDSCEENYTKTRSRVIAENVKSRTTDNSVKSTAQLKLANSALTDRKIQNSREDSSKIRMNELKSFDDNYLKASEVPDSQESFDTSTIGKKIISESPMKISNKNGELSSIVKRSGDFDRVDPLTNIDSINDFEKTISERSFPNSNLPILPDIIIRDSTNSSNCDLGKCHSFNSEKEISKDYPNSDVANEFNVHETVSNNDVSENITFSVEKISSSPPIDDSVQDTLSMSVVPAESNVSSNLLQSLNRIENNYVLVDEENTCPINYAVSAKFSNLEITSNETFTCIQSDAERNNSQPCNNNNAERSVIDNNGGNSFIPVSENLCISPSLGEMEKIRCSSVFNDNKESVQKNASCQETEPNDSVTESEKNISSIDSLKTLNSCSESTEIMLPKKSSLIITRRSSESDSSLSNFSVVSSSICPSESSMSMNHLSCSTESNLAPMLKKEPKKQCNMYSNQQNMKKQKTKSHLPAPKKPNDKLVEKSQRKMTAKLTDFVACKIRKRVSNQTDSHEIDIVERSDSENTLNTSNDVLTNHLRKTLPQHNFKKRHVKKLFDETAEQSSNLIQSEKLKPTLIIENSVETHSSVSENGEIISDSPSYSSLLNEEFKTLSLNSSESSILFHSPSQKISSSSNAIKSQASSKYIRDSKFSPQITWDHIDDMMKGIPSANIAAPILSTENLTAKISRLDKLNNELPALHKSVSQPTKNCSTLPKNKDRRSGLEFDSDTSDEDIFRHSSFRSLPISYKKKSLPSNPNAKFGSKSCMKENIWKNNENSIFKHKDILKVENKHQSKKNKNNSLIVAATLFSPKRTQNFSNILKPESPAEKRVSNKKPKNSNKLGIPSDDDYESEDLDLALNDSISYLNKWKERGAAKSEDNESTISRNYDDEILHLLNEYEELNAEQQTNSCPSDAANVTSFDSTVKNFNFDSNMYPNSQNVTSNSLKYEDLLWNSYPDSLETALTTADEKLDEVRNNLRKKFSSSNSQQSVNFNKKYKSSKDNEIESFSFLDWD